MGMKFGIEAILKSKSSAGFVINIASMAGLEGNMQWEFIRQQNTVLSGLQRVQH
jgi:hypothetical protein